MNLSGVLVVTRTEAFATVSAALSRLPGVEVHQCDQNGGKLVIVLEAENVQAEIDLLKKVKALPGVVMAEMVTHYFEEDEEFIQQAPGELDSNACIDNRMLGELNA
jgi:nitrate reductase NapD